MGRYCQYCRRMESHGLVNEVNISSETFKSVKNIYECEFRDEIEIKGKGKLKTYWIK